MSTNVQRAGEKKMKFLILIPSLGPVWYRALMSVHEQIGCKSCSFALVIQDCFDGEEGTIVIDGYYQDYLWRRQDRNYAAKNIYDGIQKVKTLGLDKMDVVVHIDGDDPGLIGNDVFQRLEKIYADKNVWLTYGSYVRASDGKVVGMPYSSKQDFRSVRWKASHLRTYRFGLIQKVPEACYKDQEGNWLKVCADLATMFPMMEMAGHDRIRFIDKPLYVYNDMSELNDHKVRGEEQIRIDKMIRSLPKFERVQFL